MNLKNWIVYFTICFISVVIIYQLYYYVYFKNSLKLIEGLENATNTLNTTNTTNDNNVPQGYNVSTPNNSINLINEMNTKVNSLETKMKLMKTQMNELVKQQANYANDLAGSEPINVTGTDNDSSKSYETNSLNSSDTTISQQQQMDLANNLTKH